jgi:hypothetical protein
MVRSGVSENVIVAQLQTNYDSSAAEKDKAIRLQGSVGNMTETPNPTSRHTWMLSKRVLPGNKTHHRAVSALVGIVGSDGLAYMRIARGAAMR